MWGVVACMAVAAPFSFKACIMSPDGTTSTPKKFSISTQHGTFSVEKGKDVCDGLYSLHIETSSEELAIHVSESDLRDLYSWLTGVLTNSKLSVGFPTLVRKLIIKDTSLFEHHLIGANMMGIVCEMFEVSVEQVTSKSKLRIISDTRAVISWVSRRVTDLSYPQMATILCHDHSCLVLATQRVERWVREGRLFPVRIGHELKKMSIDNILIHVKKRLEKD